MKKHHAKRILFIIPAVIFITLLPFVAHYSLDSHETPAEQLAKLTLKTNNEVAKIMGTQTYSVVPGQSDCRNVGEGDVFAFGRDTIHCTFSKDIHTKLSGKPLRNLVEAAGWKQRVYDDGSSSGYQKRSAFACTITDGMTYHSRQETENTFVNGLLKVDCQSFTDHYNSPLPPPQNSESVNND